MSDIPPFTRPRYRCAEGKHVFLSVKAAENCKHCRQRKDNAVRRHFKELAQQAGAK